MILLDTSAVIELLRGQMPPDQILTETIGISTIVELELLRGVLKKGGKKEKLRVEAFIRDVEVFEFDSDAAYETAKIMDYLRKKGRPIGDFDSQIAGHAGALDLPLLTKNTKHFSQVPKLKVIDWE